MPGFTNFGGGPTGQALTSPQVPAAGAAPIDPSQVGLWQKFQQRMKDDPNLRMAMLQTGLNLFRSPEPGRNNFDVFADATSTGVGTLDQLRQRDLENERRDTAAGEATRRTNISGRRADIAAGQRSDTAEARANTLTEDARQFDARLEAGDFSPAGSQSTGAERVLAADVEALMLSDPGTYPNTPEGEARARLVARDLSGLGDKLGQGRLLQKLVSDIREANLENVTFNNATPLTEQEILQQAVVTFRTITQDISGDEEDLEGTEIPVPNSPTGDVGIVEKIGEDAYVIKYNNDTEISREYTAKQIRTIQGRQARLTGDTNVE